jgi:hypothetical protein
MTQYLISFDAHAMDHIPDQEMPAVASAAHAVCQEAISAGVYVAAGGLENQPASIVAAGGAVTDRPYPQAIGGFTLVDVPSREEALEWAARVAVACCGTCGKGRPRLPATPGSYRSVTAGGTRPGPDTDSGATRST